MWVATRIKSMLQAKDNILYNYDQMSLHFDNMLNLTF